MRLDSVFIRQYFSTNSTFPLLLLNYESERNHFFHQLMQILSLKDNNLSFAIGLGMILIVYKSYFLFSSLR